MATRKKKSKKKLPPNVELIRPEDIPARKRAEKKRAADAFTRSGGGLGAKLRRRREAIEMGDPSGGSQSTKTGRLVLKKKKKKKK